MRALPTAPIALLALLLLDAGCGDRAPYFPSSEFWQALPEKPLLDEDSDSYIADLLRAKNGGRFNINVDQYNVPIARGTSATARIDVKLTHPATTGVLAAVPMPADARAAAGTDGHLAVLDLHGGASFELWQAQKKGDGWQATSGVRFDLAADGVNPTGGGIRASSLSLLLGVITYDEARGEGPIEHALAWAFDAPNSRYFAPPASSSDGKKAGRPTSVPAGARLQLDPALDVTTLGLSPLGTRIARALQRYGLFCVDTSADSSLYAESLLGSGRSWDGLLAWNELHRVPIGRLRVLKLRRKIPIP